MTFDWTTFLLEILNFFILLWILRRFLYRPILGVIAERRQKIRSQLEEAEAMRAEAEISRAECAGRLAALEEERAAARVALEREIAAERERRLRVVAEEAAEARARREALDVRQREEWERLAGERAVALGGRFVAKLLARLASPELEARLLDLALVELPAIPEAESGMLRAALASDGSDVATGFPLLPEQREALTRVLSGLAGQAVRPAFRVDPGLLSGLRIQAGSWVLGANLRDELRFFGNDAGEGDDHAGPGPG